MDSTRTISELKSAFVRSQVRILSESLELPHDWRNYAVETEEGDLSEKVIDDVLHKGMFPFLPVFSWQDFTPLSVYRINWGLIHLQ
jgi:hypothetical protein